MSIHLLNIALQAPSYFGFLKGLQSLENTQSLKLKAYLNEIPNRIASYKEFIQKYPITTYSNWHETFTNAKANPKKSTELLGFDPVRWEPTSGSTHSQKWIPYSQKFLSELDSALAPWMVDLGLRYPGTLRGCHYWSLSWQPESLRQQGLTNNDLELFPAWKKFLMNKIMAVPFEVSLLEQNDQWLLATITFLVSRSDLSFVSVWSPTFWLNICKKLFVQRNQVSKILESGEWPSEIKFGKQLGTRAPKNKVSAFILSQMKSESEVAKLWPRLSVLSCWDSSTASQFVESLRDLFPNVVIQGKGLWATEGVVTIPFADEKVLAVNSHFYEFKDLQNEKVIPSWELRDGQEVEPIVTAGNALKRYTLGDRLKVRAIKGKPYMNFDFIGRLQTFDIAGEKISTSTALEILSEVSKRFHCQALSFLCDTNQRSYRLLLVPTPETPDAFLIEESLEEMLSRHYHYKVARELGQLKKSQVVVNPQAVQIYMDAFKKNRGLASDGQIKIEPILLVSKGI
jgi:hypothetical protein